jgi:hypothetical protein
MPTTKIPPQPKLEEPSPLEQYYSTGQGYGPLDSYPRGQTGWESYYLPLYKCPTG